MTKKIAWVLIALFAAPASAGAAFRVGLGSSAAKRAANVMDDAIPATPVMILPILPLQSVTTGQVVWPFGVQGGGHPNGHPGFDFQTVVGGSVLATASARVYKIEDDFTDGVPQKLIMLETSAYQIVYVGSLTNLAVSPGDIVSKGQKIAELGQSRLSYNPVGNLHWGVNSRSQQAAVCPYDFLSPEARTQLDGLFALSTYTGQAQYPLICNPCPPGGCR